MYNDKTVSIVMSTYNEKDSIRSCIDAFYNTGYVDEVIIVDNNAIEGTVDEVRKTQAILIHEKKQGYGYGFQAGLAHATSDLIVMCEPDGTFVPADLIKFLVYSEDVDIILGSRTCSTMILDDANMGMFLKYGNYFVAKLIELLFIHAAPHLSDCGCTYRLLRREAYQTIQPFFQEGRSAFGLEVTLLALRAGLPLIEIPIRYNKRVGESMVTGSFHKAFILGLKMIFMSFKACFQNFFHPLLK